MLGCSCSRSRANVSKFVVAGLVPAIHVVGRETTVKGDPARFHRGEACADLRIAELGLRRWQGKPWTSPAMKGCFGGSAGAVKPAAVPAKIENALRETLKPLKTLKTAKFGDFPPQGYQGLNKTHDFAGETISLRFGPKAKEIVSLFVSREIFGVGERAGPGCLKNLEKAPSSKKAFFSA